MPEDTYGSGGGVEGGVSNPVGQGGVTTGPVSADEVVDSVSTSVAPPNPVSVSATPISTPVDTTPSSTPVSVTPNPFVGQGGAVGNPNVISSANFGAGMGDVGDIVLNKGDKVKPKRRVFLAVLALVVVVGGVLALLGGKIFETKNGKSAVASDTLVTMFDEYANYLLYGGENNDRDNLLVADINISDTFYIDDNWRNLDYLDDLLVKYNSFYDNSSVLGGVLSEIPMVVSKENIEFLIDYQENDWLDIKAIYAKYDSEGSEGTRVYIKAYYGESPSQIEELDIERMLARVDLLDSTGTTERVSEADDAFSELVYDKRLFLKYQCREIARALSGMISEVQK